MLTQPERKELLKLYDSGLSKEDALMALVLARHESIDWGNVKIYAASIVQARRDLEMVADFKGWRK